MSTVLACALLWPALFGIRVLLPSHLLSGIAPWTSVPPTPGRWNPLAWDGIAQFYPWRQLLHDSVRSGRLPLWNPYQFAGAPVGANSQSAPFYPPNLLFAVMPVTTAFAWSAAIHIAAASWFTWLLLRRMGLSGSASILGGVTYAASGWQCAWLALPSFLDTSVWIPAALAAVLWAWRQQCRRGPALVALAASVALMLLAGHLQVAFYGVIAIGAMTIGLIATRKAPPATRLCLGIATCGAVVLGAVAAAPQLLPAVELSRNSHRAHAAGTGGYAAYTAYAVPKQTAASVFLPDIFGDDTGTGMPYWNYYTVTLPGDVRVAVRHNAAETAMYAGVIGLLLGIVAIVRVVTDKGWVRKEARPLIWFAALSALALGLAFGTPLNAVFYYGVPGFSMTGSPGRSLVLWALGAGGVAACGLDAIRARPVARRELAGVAAVGALGLAISLAWLAAATREPLPGQHIPSLGQVLAADTTDWLRLAAAVAVVAAALAAHQLPTPRWVLPAVIVAGVAVDLVSSGISRLYFNPPGSVYASTPGVRWLQEHVGHDRVMPINTRWSLYTTPAAVLPPNAASVFALRDVQGYDSLFPGAWKRYADSMALPRPDGTRDASPPEVGNMVFAQDSRSPLASTAGVRFIVTTPQQPAGTVGGAATEPVYAGPDMDVWSLARIQPRASLSVPGSVAWLADTPTRVSLSVTATAAGALVLADERYPGWHAEVDGRGVAIEPAAAASVFRSVAVGAGTHTVTFRYDQASLRVGLYGLCACLALCLGVLAATWERTAPQELLPVAPNSLVH